ncbi:MAG: GNAT family N-acetyltransferase [Bacteroidetes bacterium]|nr:GNAT family N-acetyltransferase [Bacteroidota bacterium]
MFEIKLCNINEAEDIFKIYDDCRKAMQSAGIFQWQNDYPTLETVIQDIESNNLYGYYEEEIEDGKCIGAISINTHQDEEYKGIDWKGPDENVIVIHRLAVNPEFQAKGIARLLMDFAEDLARKENYSAIRLDSYSQNKRALKFYENRGYQKRGECFFAGRDKPFHCLELIF